MFINPDELTPTIAEKIKAFSTEEINTKDKNGNTILHIAASGINCMLLESLLSNSRLNINGQNNEGDTALSSMLSENCRDKVYRSKPIKQFLLNNNSERYLSLDVANKEGKMARQYLNLMKGHSQSSDKEKVGYIIKAYDNIITPTNNLASWIKKNFPSPDSSHTTSPNPKSSEVIDNLKMYENNKNLLSRFLEITHNMDKKHINECFNRVDNYISDNFTVLTKICNNWQSKILGKEIMERLLQSVQRHIFNI